MARPIPSRDEIADRISAYVYGNILVLASLVVLHHDEIERGFGFALVLGTAVSTFIAHAFSEGLGASVRQNEHASMQHILRDSLPIVSAASVPAALMAVGAFGWIEPVVCLRLAEAWVIVRLAITSFIVGRLQGHPVTGRTWFASLALAAVAVAIVAIKVVLTH
ncbi:hypothetical protein [Aeromicrobium sp. UC242_57]|uniref:hypothetical protein n=1 Tax=Aeromicrobium sp. UC242_57 TaxID=3374624 RepID=UPI0037924D8A